ncbi:hypothetical protein EBU99_01750 [bacterium]|nr:hypothetical protein [bacterium]
MNKQEFNGKTLDEALAAAARALGTDVTLISYNILPQGSGGLLSKLFQRGVRLEAWVDDSSNIQAAAREAVRQAMAGAQDMGLGKPIPARNDREKPKSQPIMKSQQGRISEKKRADGQSNRPQTQQRNPRPEREQNQRRERAIQPRPPLSEEEIAERLNRPRIALKSENSQNVLIELANHFAKGFDPESTPSATLNFLNEEEVVVSVMGASNLEELLTRSDRLSCAFEHLFKRIAQKRFGDVSGRVTLNAGTAAEQREEKLRTMALDVAAKVKENGRTITLSSKSSQERRVIHLALENMEGIATKSVGVGDNRKLVIYSTLRPTRGADSQNQQRRDADSEGQGRRPRRRGRRGGGRHRQGGHSHHLEPNSQEQESSESSLTHEL